MTDNSTGNRTEVSLPTEAELRAERTLQAELDRMAAEVPEIPESFRQGWREAVRRDAAAGNAARRETGTPEKAGKEPGEEKKRRVIPWNRILGTAAAAAILLGTVMTGREALLLTQRPEKAARTMEAAPAAKWQSETTAQPTGMPTAELPMAAAGALKAKSAEPAEEEQGALNSSAAAPMEEAFMADAAMFMEEAAEMEEAAPEETEEADRGLEPGTAVEAETETGAPGNTAKEAADVPETAPGRGGLWAGIGLVLLGLGLEAAALIRRKKLLPFFGGQTTKNKSDEFRMVRK